jgi:hypothetical protein
VHTNPGGTDTSSPRMSDLSRTALSDTDTELVAADGQKQTRVERTLAREPNLGSIRIHTLLHGFDSRDKMIFLRFHKGILIASAFFKVIHAAVNTASLLPLLSSGAVIDTDAPRWSHYKAPLPGAVVHPASEADVQITVRMSLHPLARAVVLTMHR